MTRNDKKHRYLYEWGNYKSDRNKTKRILGQEIGDILSYGEFSKKDLIAIKDLCKTLGFDLPDTSSQLIVRS